ICGERIHPNDVRRMIRALEVFELTGKPMSAWQTQWPLVGRLRLSAQEDHLSAKPQAAAVVWLDLSRDELYERINQRVEAMFATGWAEEARQLRTLPRPLSREASKALGYQEVCAMLEGKITLKEAIAQVQTRSRNF